MKIVFASDSFKGSLSCQQINAILQKTAEKVFENCQTVPLLISDGGEGALDAIVSYKGGKIENATVNDPLFRPINARFGVLNDVAVISMSEASGLPLLLESERNPLNTTTYGTGQLIKLAVEKGYKKLYVTIGGSATNDGGIGALTALGVKFIKKDGNVAKGVGSELEDIVEIDDSALSNYSDLQVTVLCDVTNPLTGELGATRVFGKQKGANKEIADRLENGMLNYKSVLDKKYSINSQSIVGGGAAGGLGTALKVFLGGKMQSGIDAMLDLADFDDAIDGASFVVTGEGRIDSQSVGGKVISGILKRTSAKKIPTFAIVGSVGNGAETAYELGLCGIYSLIDTPSSLDEILKNSQTLYAKTAESLFRTIKSLIK